MWIENRSRRRKIAHKSQRSPRSIRKVYFGYIEAHAGKLIDIDVVRAPKTELKFVVKNNKSIIQEEIWAQVVMSHQLGLNIEKFNISQPCAETP